MSGGDSAAAPEGGKGRTRRRRRRRRRAPRADGFDCRWLGASFRENHWHFHRRLLERYGIVLAPGDFARMMKDIRDGRAVVVERLRGERAVFAVDIESTGVCVYVLARWPSIYTALPPTSRLDELWRRATDILRLGYLGTPEAPGART